VKRERSRLVALATLAVSGAMVLGLSGTASAIFDNEDGYSYTQPGAELVMPYDTTDNDLIPPGPARVSFLTASNISDRDVTTHWIFWNDSCDEEVNFSICLTENDTVVVDPRNMSALGADNEKVGPEISLRDVKGVVTVIAYETDEDCSPFNDLESQIIADDSIVGAFTFADTDVGYSFGNDAFALGTDSLGEVEVPEPSIGNDFEFALQIFNPIAVETSVAVLTHLEEHSSGIVVPSSGSLRFHTEFVDTTEIPVSLPDVTVSCTKFFTLSGGNKPIIPPTTTIDTSGIVRLFPAGGLVNGDDYLYGIVGQAIERFGASASVKVEQVEGSPSPAFVDGTAQGLF